ncbi:LysE family translocator [Nitratidesulfovibrio sp. SRB-5]|uniref:LysE family translocator n=1 Tax=Nitratidesulfovibrio sp. SRB-5 TaxID=2872636 RepID=UPI0010280DF1|nr:LysE family translocator [Nitratidesulfovibrio sp. SRB-5]MBZ2173230.1 LysE family translocator [Nitratidesulfovibrio sp. SRB-5]RXF75838.1 LysE family translocator [Desulfovibrio sp. DS-1]
MTIHSLAALAVALFILAITPGPGVFAVLSAALGRGLPTALALTAGIICGDMVFLLLAMAGLTVLAESMGELFLVVRLGGAAYLIWLGIGLWRGAATARPHAAPGEAASENPAPGAGSACDTAPLAPPTRLRLLRLLRTACGGLALTLGNPKVIVFYVGFLPTFVDMRTLDATGAALVAATTVAVVGCVLGGYAVMAARARRMLSTPRATRLLHRGAGAVMVGTGAAIATR